MLRLTLTIALLALPSLAAATGCAEKHQAQNCAEGYAWDATSQSCVQQVTG